MNRTQWTIQTQTGSGGSWEDSSYTFYCPNENMEKSKTGTLVQVRLANGSNAFTSPETKFNYEAVVMMFLAIDPTDTTDEDFIDSLNALIDGGIYVKVIDSDNNEMIGIFTAMTEVWISGVENCHDYQVTFMRMI